MATNVQLYWFNENRNFTPTNNKQKSAVRFGERIRALRNAKGLSQCALAAKVTVTFGYVSKIENDNLDFGDYPSQGVIRRIAKGRRRSGGIRAFKG
jgi:ribosome-binding protein aMBF1 (putative translation factor)